MQRIEELGLNGLKIYQDDALYHFTSDSVLLTRFALVKKGDVVADFCSGSGIVGLHLYALNPDKISSLTLVELQTPLFELSKKSIEINALGEKISAVNSRVQDLGADFIGKYSLIVCNPPYMKVQAGQMVDDPSKAVCKSEIALSLEELILSISKCLKYGGRTCLVHRADRLVDIVCLMRANGIEPKRLQTVKNGDKDPYLILIEGVKGGKSGLKILGAMDN